MALASGHWVEKEIHGEAPSPRHGHALAVAGNVAFLFGGVSNINQEPTYLNDLYLLTVSSESVSWEAIPQSGETPPPREGHTLCVVKGKLFLFGGTSKPDAAECLQGVHCFDIVSLTWHLLATTGVALRTVRHASVAVGDNIYVYGGIQEDGPTDDLVVFNTVSCTWTPVKTTGSLPSARYSHTLAALGKQVLMLGGCGEDGEINKDVHALNTENLMWQRWEVKGESPQAWTGHTLTAHHDKDIYLFGGLTTNKDGSETSSKEIHKLSIAKMKWKVPLYVGIPPMRRHGHTAFILHSHLFIFGGRNEEQEFNDLKMMKLINPSERQPVMKEILSEFGLQGISHGFAATKVPNVKYELREAAPGSPAARSSATYSQVSVYQDFGVVRNQALEMIHSAFSLLDQEFHKVHRAKMELSQAAASLQAHTEAQQAQKQQQEQELQQMIDRHRSQNESWLRARAEENDRERRELSGLREELIQEQHKLREEEKNVQKRSEHLLSIMQQFKGM